MGALEVAMRVTRDDTNQGARVKFSRLFGGRSDGSVRVSHARPVERDTERELLGVDFSNLDRGSYVPEGMVRGGDQSCLSATTNKSFDVE